MLWFLLLAAVICLYLFIFSLSPWIYTILFLFLLLTHIIRLPLSSLDTYNPLPLSSLDTYNPSVSSLRYETLRIIIINFLALWSIYLSSLHVHFKNDSEYLTRGTTQVFILLIFLQQNLVSRSLLSLLRYFFLNFSFISVWWCPLSIFPNTCNFPSLQAFLCFPDLAVLFLLLFLFSHFSLLDSTFFDGKFHSHILAIYSYCLHILIG